MKVARTAIAIVLGFLLPLLVQLWDRRHLDGEERQRVWNFASWGSALYAFGPLSMLGWSWVTRRNWMRVVMGPVSLGAIVLLMGTIDGLLHASTGAPPEGPWTDLPLGALIAVGLGLLLLLLLLAGQLIVSWWRRRRAAKPAR
jgi:hypothetical protein